MISSLLPNHTKTCVAIWIKLCGTTSVILPSFCRQWVLPNDGSIAQNIDDIIAADIEDAKPIVAIAQYFTCLLPKLLTSLLFSALTMTPKFSMMIKYKNCDTTTENFELSAGYQAFFEQPYFKMYYGLCYFRPNFHFLLVWFVILIKINCTRFLLHSPVEYYTKLLEQKLWLFSKYNENTECVANVLLVSAKWS